MPHAIRQGDIPGVQLRCDLVLPVPAAEAWRWLAEAELAKRWLAESVAHVGDELMLESRLDDGSSLRERGRTLASEEASLWLLAFERLDDGWEAATELRIEFVATEPPTLSVLQRGFERLSLSSCLSVWEFYRRRWRSALERLGDELRAVSVQS